MESAKLDRMCVCFIFPIVEEEEQICINREQYPNVLFIFPFGLQITNFLLSKGNSVDKLY